MEDKLSSLFSSLYKIKHWGNNNTPFFSGFGSHTSPTIPFYIETVKTFLKGFTYKPNIIDIGCGDFNIGKQFVPFVNNYLAIDIVDDLIKYNKSIYNYPNVTFKTLDITQTPIPPTDVIIIRHVFQHLSNSYIKSALQNIYLKSKYLIITECIPSCNFTPNLDILPGYFFRPEDNNSGVDILSPPFNFSIEEELITLSIKEIDIFDKTIIFKTKMMDN
jgi:hypothetical protein